MHPEKRLPAGRNGITLRSWSDTDVPAMVALFNEAEVARWTTIPIPFDVAAARAYVEHARTTPGLLIAAVIEEGGSPLGQVAAVFGEDPATVSLGYVIGQAHRGRGLAHRATTVLAEWVAADPGVGTLEFLIDPENEPSVRVAGRMGFRRTDDPLEVRRSGDRQWRLGRWTSTAAAFRRPAPIASPGTEGT